ncbi:MAG: methylmalonyl-CoA mutase family protein [Bacteroidetes bacterium]|nr:methylmalonyl-CoA mutase family protein [Bacteroidota bacterium]
MDPQEKNKHLFSEFPPVSTEQWEELIRYDLKGADYDKKLIWKTDEGFDVRPYYRGEDLENLEYLRSLPGDYPFVRGNKNQRNNWIIRQDFHSADLHEANRLALEAIAKGTDAVGFNVKEITTHKQINQLLEGIDLTRTGIHFISSRSYPLTLELFIYEVGHRQLGGEKISGSINFDPISFLLLTGNSCFSGNNNFEEAEYLINTAYKRLPEMKVITVNGHYYQDAGSTLVQELAFSLASGHEYLSELVSKGFSADVIAPRIQFCLATGSDYFLEIAKLRAARLLWAKIVEQYHPENQGSMNMFIHSVTSMRNKTIYDPFVNMLRTTTEGMAAAIGNADSISILPFDLTYKDPDDFSLRIARNQQLIFKEESHLDKTIDPAAGSYYIESLTDSIAFQAWNLFKLVEEKGGMIACIKSGFVQVEVEKSCRKKSTDIIQRKTVSIGTNQYPNLLENMLEKIERVHDENVKEPAVPYKKLKISRSTEVFETLRLATERHIRNGNKKPSIFLFTIGNLAMRKARAAFATNFFGIAGYEIIDNPGFSTVEEGVEAAVQSCSEIIVICSSDNEYTLLAPEICKGIKGQDPGKIVIIAGYPNEIIDSLKEAGIDDFIHLRSNLIETLAKYHKKLGIL